MRHLFLLHFLLFGFVADVSAFCETSRRFGGNLGTSLDTTFQLQPSTSDMLQTQCNERTQFARQFEVQDRERRMQLEIANEIERRNLRPFESLPLDRGRLSLKIQGDGYTIRFRRRSVSINWTF